MAGFEIGKIIGFKVGFYARMNRYLVTDLYS